MLEDRTEELLAEPGAVGVVRRFAFAPAADPVRYLFEHDGVADQQLHGVRLVGGHAYRNSDQVALALKRRPAALPRHLVAPRPGLTDSAVAGERDVFAVLVATANQFGHVLVDVLCDQGRKRQGTVVDGRPVLDLEDRVGGGSQGPDHTGVARAEGSPLDELDVLSAPPALAFAARQVFVRAGPAAALLAVAVGAHPGRFVSIGGGGGRRLLLDLVLDRDLIGDRLDGRVRHARLRHVVERTGEFLAALEALAPVLCRGLPDDVHDRRGDGS